MDFAALRARAETAANSARHQLQAATNSSSSSSTASSQSRAPLAKPASYTPRSSDAPVRPPLAGAPPSSSAKKYGSTAPAAPDSAHDKRALFSALDEFFSARLGIAIEPLEPAHDVHESSAREMEPPSSSEGPFSRAPKPKPTPPPRSLKPPPPVSRSTRPVSPAHHSLVPRSYPPAETHSSAALSLLHWLLDPPDLSRQLNNNPESGPPFFLPPPASQNPLPPVLAGRNDVRSSFSWRQRGEEKTYGASFLFGDGSVAWIRLSWHASSERRGTVTRDVQREGRYRPRPDIARDWDGDRLYAASETYGPRIVRFAQDAVRGGQLIARGECWDLANEALKACEDEMPATRRPMPSIARTHGALLYYANAARATGRRVLGEWTGGDSYVRPGDIVEWRSVKIREVGMGPGSYSTLGDPEHTALIISAGSPVSPPALPASGGPPYLDPAYPLSSLVSLTVVEQSLGSAPAEKTYDLAAMSAGEVWIYRPCALRELCGIEELGPGWPDEVGVQSWELGELEW